MEFRPGDTVQHYRIVEKIGEGGMGVVWKALDTTLDRTVAIKLLPTGVGDDPERLVRLEREAKSLASLNHPNVASLFGLHDADGTRFLTMEFVEGEDLAQRVARGSLPVDETLRIGIGIAEALSAAHLRGIVHRDLKPANVLLDEEGIPKVLDFGLAKIADPVAEASGSSDPSASPTLTSLGTVAGVLLGTAAYMSPEQARGKAVDKRTDTWALGCVLFECLTGRAPFRGETISDTLASVLKTEPEWDLLPTSTPPALVRVLRRCLSKNMRDRFQDAGDLRYELERVLDEPTTETSAKAPPARRFGLAAVALLLLTGIILGFAVRHLIAVRSGLDVPTQHQRTVSEVPAAPGTVFGVREVSLALSPDGSMLAYAGVDEDGVSRLHVRTMSDGRDVVLPGTEGVETPFWSPDGREIAFHAGSTLKRIGLQDPQPRTIAEVQGHGGAWSRGGLILTSGTGASSFKQIDVETGETTQVGLDLSKDSNVESVWILPDDEHYLIEVTDYGGDREDGVYVGAYGSDDLRQILAVNTNVAYSSGHVLYHDDSRIMAHKIDLDRVELEGDPMVIADPVFELSYPFHAFFTVARDLRRLVYLEGTGETLQSELVWLDREGNVIERTGIVGDFYNPTLSGDGRRVLIDVSTPETEGDIWLFDLARGSSRRLTDDRADESNPVWSVDGDTVFFYRLNDFYRIDLSGSGEAVHILTSDNNVFPNSMSGAGKLVFSEIRDDQYDLWILDTTDGTSEAWKTSAANTHNAEVSPDGKWIAYQSDETGRYEIYVESFPEGGERFQVSRAGGSNPSWRGDAQELYYVSASGEIVAVSMDLGAETRPVGEPQTLFRPKLRRDLFAPHPDGSRFLAVLRLDPEIDRAVLIDDWDAPDRAP